MFGDTYAPKAHPFTKLISAETAIRRNLFPGTFAVAEPS